MRRTNDGRMMWLVRIWVAMGEGWPWAEPRKRWVPRRVNDWLDSHDWFPMRVWALAYCRQGHSNDGYGMCVSCQKDLR